MSPVGGQSLRSPLSLPDGLALICAFALATAGLAHLSVAAAHFGEWWLTGALFLFAAAAQLGLAVGLALRPSRPLCAAAGLLSLGLIATWAVSRTGGLPFGPEAGVPEAPGPLDVLTTLEEITLLGLLALSWTGTTDGRSRRLLAACETSGAAFGVALTLAFAAGIGHG